jgi:mono/diheme cytochrome c family protein
MHKLLRFLLAGVFLAGCCLSAQDLAVTDVEGASWLNHLGRSFNDTNMGKTGRLGPSPDMSPGEIPDRKSELSPVLAPQTVTLHGADVYRLNCQGCHGASGLGAPPEINSIIYPVRATSVALVMERMKKVGMDVSPTNAEEMARQSRTALLLRLHQGGESMPPFPHLSEPEIRVLMAYLKQLAGLPGAEREQVTVIESRVRVGEHIAKSTCHICHDATGPNPSPEQLLEGTIPPLSTLTARKKLPEFVRKITQGAPVLMGEPPLSYRGRMPVFGYLSEDEAADVYLYLTFHQPQAPAIVTASTASVGLASTGGFQPDNHPYSPAAASGGDVQPVSLVRFAFFPTVLFLVLAAVVMRCLPMAAKAFQTNESESGAYTAAGDGRAAVATRGIGEKRLPLAKRDPAESRYVAGARSGVPLFEAMKRY